MLFNPDYSLKILTGKEFSESIGSINEILEKCRVSGFFDSFDGKKIYYEYFLCRDAKASVVIVHGLSEFTKKYYELAYYFLNLGYNVFLYDQRCHGLSERLTERVDLIHVDRFDDYVKDLEIYIDTIVAKNKGSNPLYIFSHSMGGTVTAMYLKKHTDKVEKAVLSAPLFEPQIGNIPVRLARLTLAMKHLLCGKKSVFQERRFDPDGAMKRSTDTDRDRFMYNLNMRCSEPKYQSTPMTTRWVYNSLRLVPDFKKHRIAESITTPLLLISAQNDTVVRNDRQTAFAEKCAACRMLTIESATHSLMTGGYDILTHYINEIVNFIKL